jgi:subfamily B ATP-binding cassette protein MsbA
MKHDYGWFDYLKRGLLVRSIEDRIHGRSPHNNVRKSLQNLYPFVVRHWRKGLIGGLLVLAVSVLSFPQPLIGRFLIDRVMIERQIHKLAVAVLLLAGIILAEKLMNLFREFYLARFEQTVILDIQQELFGHCMALPKAFFDSQETGYLMSRVSSDVQGLRWLFSDTIFQMLANGLRLAGGVAFLLYLEWKLALCILILFPGVLLLLTYFADRLRALGHQGMERQARLASRIQESLSAISLIKAFSSEDKTQRRIRSIMRSILRLSLEQTAVNSTANFALGILPSAIRGIVLVLGAYWVVHGHWTLGTLLAFQVYLGFVFGPAQFLATSNLQLQNARAALERVSSVFDIVPEGNSGKGEIASRLSGEVDFRNVSFSYNGRETVFENLTFHVGPGQHCAIIGPSGAGKTTLLGLLLQFYRPTAGKILFDGRASSGYEIRSLRHRIGYVAQTTLLISGTIRENLLYGNADADEEELVSAARAAGIYEYIQMLPDGFLTRIGENGVALSEGQKQRLSIARALVKNPDILILDEPTSAVDRFNEKSFFQALPAYIRNKTLFIATHRYSTIQECDLVLLLDKNRILTVGTHAALLQSSGYYQALLAEEPKLCPECACL